MSIDVCITDGKSKWINEEIKNKYNNSEFRIPLRNKHKIIIEYALVNEKDFAKANKYKWHLNGKYCEGYVDKKSIRMHHFILKKPAIGNEIDHIDEDKLNNDINNLREVIIEINKHNVSKYKKKTSSVYKGVSYNKKHKKFVAACNGLYLGIYEKEIDAAIAYDKYTYKCYGLLANNNKLISYNDTIELQLNDLIKTKIKKLPKYIQKSRKNFRAEITYNKIRYIGKPQETIGEAQQDLIIFQLIIKKIKEDEEIKYLNTPISRNSNNQAIIKVKDIEVIVDDHLWHKLNKIKWSIVDEYVIGSGSVGRMHRYVMRAKKDEIVDHINHIKHDNALCNLRIATHTVNSHNKSKSKNATSRYYGVSYRKENNSWKSKINKDSVEYNLGYYVNEIDAAKVYNLKAIELYGTYANLNIF